MNIEQRANYWEDWSVCIAELAREVSYALEEFLPVRYQEDKDAESVLALHDMLDTVRSFADERYEESQKECERMYNAWEYFEAWSLGLCPKMMREYERSEYRRIGDAGDRDMWPEIATYLTSKRMSQESTVWAVELWRKANHKEVA